MATGTVSQTPAQTWETPKAVKAIKSLKTSGSFWFGSVFTKSLRQARTPILAWGIGMGFLTYVVYAALKSVLGTPATANAAQQLAESFRFFGDPVAVGTPGGYFTWKYGPFIPLMVGIWAVLAGANMTRGEEERGSLDLLLAEPISRTRALVEKIGAFAVALLIIGFFIAIGALLGAASIKTPVSVGDALLAGLNISLVTFFFGMLALFISQFTRTGGSAAGWAGGLMALSFVVDGIGRAINNAEWLRRLSPLYYYDLSKPLIPGYGTNAGAMIVLLALGVILAVVSVPLFAQRDLGGIALAWLFPQEVNKPRLSVSQSLASANRDFSTQSVGLRALAAQGASAFWWIVGLTAYTLLLAGITKTMITQMSSFFSSPLLAKLFNGSNLATNNGFLNSLVFSLLPVGMVFFAVVMAFGWASDLDNKRVETTLSAPLPRWRMLLERFGVVVLFSVLAAFFVWLGVVVAAVMTGLSIDVGGVAAASFGVLPLELIAAGLVYALAGRLSAYTTLGIVGGLVLISFFMSFLKELLKLPDWAENLSIFQQYGAPLTNGINWGATIVMLVITVAFVVIGAWQFSRSDVK